MPLVRIPTVEFQVTPSIYKFGTNDAVGTGTFEDIWAAGGDYPWPTTAEPVRVRSGGNANDTAAGSGAQKVRVFGLNGDFEEINEELTLAGASESASSTQSFQRVYRAYVTDTGTYGGTNTGNILIENESSNQLLGQIMAGVGQTQLALYTMPKGRTGYILEFGFEIESGKPVDLEFFQRPAADVVSGSGMQAPRILEHVISGTGNGEISFAGAPLVVAPKTDIWVRGKATAQSARVSAHFTIQWAHGT